MIKKIYPIGTCVKLEKSIVVIIGRFRKIDEDNFHDYVGIRFPLGYEGIDKLINFQEDEIKEVLKLGYINDLEKEETARIKDILKD